MKQKQEDIFNKIKYSKFKEIINNIYNNCVVLDYFCANQLEIEALSNIAPIIKTITDEADFLNSILINNDIDEFS